MLDKLDILEYNELENVIKSEYKQLLKKLSKYNV